MSNMDRWLKELGQALGKITEARSMKAMTAEQAMQKLGEVETILRHLNGIMLGSQMFDQMHAEEMSKSKL
jgi:hypothetical protein